MWAIFTTYGPLPDSLQKLNTEIWQDWYPREGQKRQMDSSLMLEVYQVDDMQDAQYELCNLVAIKGMLMHLFFVFV